MRVALRPWKRVWLRRGVHLAATADSTSTFALLLNFRARTGSYGFGVVYREMAWEFGDGAYKPVAHLRLPRIASNDVGEHSRRAQQGHQTRHPLTLKGATEFHVAPRLPCFVRALPSASQMQGTG